MPREFGQLDSSAWRDDEDWRALPADAQWLYGLLVSQSDLSAAGVLTLAVNRWQRMCADMTPERITEALATLEGRRFVFVDFDDLELLVRSYARRKTQWGNPKRRTAVVNAAAAIHSQRLRRALAADLSRAGIVVDGLPAISPSDVAEFSAEGSPERLAIPYQPHGKQIESGSRARAHQTPDAQTPDAQTPKAGTAPAAPSPASARRGTRVPEPFVVTDDMRKWAHGEQLTDAWVDRVTESFVDYWRARPGAGGVKLDWPATWRTWLRREAERNPPRGRQGDRFAGHLQLIEQLGEEGA